MAPRSLDAVFTDPPYFGNVQYGELMDFCYVWLRRLVGNKAEGFNRASTRSPHELMGNVTEERGLEHFTEGLSAVYSRMAGGLKPGAPLVFTYHHNKLDAYYAVGVAILDAGLVCSASLPCPAEMGGSIHIHGTTSSIIDTVFVCRASGATPARWLFETPGATRCHRNGRFGKAGERRQNADLRRPGDASFLATLPAWQSGNSVRVGTAGCPRRRSWRLLPEAVFAFGTAEQLVERVATGRPGVPLQGSLYVADASEEEAYSAIPF